MKKLKICLICVMAALLLTGCEKKPPTVQPPDYSDLADADIVTRAREKSKRWHDYKKALAEEWAAWREKHPEWIKSRDFTRELYGLSPEERTAWREAHQRELELEDLALGCLD